MTVAPSVARQFLANRAFAPAPAPRAPRRAVDTATRTRIVFGHLVKVFTKSGDYGTRVRAGSAASRVRGLQCRVDAGAVGADAALAADAGEAVGVRIRHSATRRCPRALLSEVLHGGGAVHHLRHRDRLHDSVGRVLSTTVVYDGPREQHVPVGPHVVLRARGDARVHRDPARRVHLRVEEGSAAMGLSRSEPNIELTGNEPWITTKLDDLVN